MPEKRPRIEDTLQDHDGNKRVRSNNGSPAPPPSNGAGAAKPDAAKVLAEARARAEAVRARLAAMKSGGSGVASPAPSSTGAAPTPPPANLSPVEAARAKIEAMKARVAAATAASKASNAPPARTASPMPVFQPPPEFDDTGSKARGGLNIGLHPALMGDAGQDARARGRQAMQPKFATTMANRRRTDSPGMEKKPLDLSGPSLEEIRKNPYFDANLSGQTISSRNRASRQLIFNQKGKFIQQANALRRQAALEQMKKRIAEQSRKAGLDEDNEKAFLVEAPPDVEWWDEGLLDGKDYEDLDRPGKVKIDTPDSIITIYVQHPVLLEPPQEKIAPAPKAMFLTRTEQRKLRRQRRMADHKEQQAKIRLGLEPPPPPKVKKSNMMRVYGDMAVKDPTAVEALVNKQVAERAQKHQDENEARKLTKEQKHEKLEANQEADAAKGIYAMVFKIDNLSNGQHRYKIDINAKQSALTGITILNPKFNLVIVEGGTHSVKFYKKLMLNRIHWNENAAPSSVREGNREAEAAWLRAEDEQGNLKDLSMNRCQLVWEGQERARSFRKWSSRICETDTDAKEILARAKMEHFWTLAKSMQ